jgi:hypothetical protein
MTTTTSATLEEMLSGLRNNIDAELSLAWRMLEPAAHLALLATATDKLAGVLHDIGAKAEGQREDDVKGLSDFIVYEWMEDGKDFLILLRNILFEEHKALLMVQEKRIGNEAFASLKSASRQTVDQATEELLRSLKEGPTKPIQLTNKRAVWRLQNSPWSVYIEQINTLRQQTVGLGEQANDLRLTAEIYQRIKSLFNGTFGQYLDYLQDMTAGVDEALREVPEDKNEINATALLKTIRQFVNKASEPNTAAEFIERLEALTRGLPSGTTLVTSTDGGLLLQREINIRRATTNWLESELMNEVQDFYTRRRQIQNRLQMAVTTGENRIEFDRQEVERQAGLDMLQTLGQLTKNLHRSIEAIAGLRDAVELHLTNELFAWNVYTPGFLDLDMRQTISRYRGYQRNGLQQLRDWTRNKFRSLRDAGRENLRAEELSLSERIVRLVRARSVQPENAHYSSMFLTNGYTGESFRVGRTAELARVEQIVENWKLGYRGAVLITGQRMSGKTFFGELIGHRFFSNSFVTLTPGVRIDLGGRTLEPTRDLKAAVEFVVKNHGRKPMMVWIDDLSNWRDEITPLASDVRNLLQEIDYCSDKLFFVVSVGTELHAQLQRHSRIDHYFQAVLPMRRMRLEEINQAIRIRHGATQLNLVNEEDETLTDEQINRLVLPIYAVSRGHIGDALRQWAYAVEVNTDENVRFTEVPAFAFPEELSSDAGVLLRTILIDRTTNEYQLRKQFGPAFTEHFQPLVQRLLNLGLLLRTPSNMLEINPALVADIQIALEANGFVLSDNSPERPTL